MQPPRRTTDAYRYYASKKTRAKLDPSLFDPMSIRDEVALENSIAILEGYLGSPEVDKERFLLDLLEHKNLLPLVLSSVSKKTFDQFTDGFLEDFPLSPEHFPHSISSVLLDTMSHYYGSLCHPAPNLDLCQRAVELARPVIDALTILCAAEDIADVEPDGPRSSAKRRLTQSKAKKMKRAQELPHVDPEVFQKIEEAIPTSKEEAISLATKVLRDQKDVLTYYFEVLRKPELYDLFRDSYAPAQALEGAVADHQPDEAPNQEPILPELFSESTPCTTSQTFEVLTADLFFKSADGFGDWRIIIGQKCSRDLRAARKKNKPQYDIIVKKLRELSHGFFSGDNQKRLAGPDNGIPIFEAKMTGDSRLVYRIDCVQEYGSDVETQAIRVYGIYTHAKMQGSRFWDAVSRTVGAGNEYRNRCLYRTASTGRGQDVTFPASWPPSQSRVTAEDMSFPGLSADEKQELRSLLQLEKYIPFSQALINSINADEDIAHPFYMSLEERLIVRHTGSTFVLGRSGTGKTTVILNKMVGLERAWRALDDDVRQTLRRPRQIFVTQSRVLAEKVEDAFHKSYSVLEAEGPTTNPSEQITQARARSHGFRMIDANEDEWYRQDLPTRFSELKDEHFPLFVTSNYLFRLLEADFALLRGMGGQSDSTSVPQVFRDSAEHHPSNYMLQTHGGFVSYNRFLASYWTHFPQELTKSLSPSSTFAEIMGVIKGSEKTLRGENGHLDKVTYCQESLRVSSFSGQREVMFAIFEAYMKTKKRLGEYDAADRSHDLVRALIRHGVPGDKVDYVYVDEAQDNLLIDSLILRYICGQPDGIFWAGDTAQTISAGSSFRFQDLTAFMHRVEQGTRRHRPKSFQLTKNYRSHGGIVKCAQAIVRLLTKLWPDSIDLLAEEKGMIDGPLPIYFGGGEQYAPRFDQFLSDESGEPIEFGARQCILVRTEAAAERLRDELGDIGIIMTLYESKGLEFDDVLLYNFFTDSTVGPSRWRVVLNGLPEEDNAKRPTFHEQKHEEVCRELKRLYVGVTRARVNLWFIDYSDKGEPMRCLWQSHEQVETWLPGMPVPRLVKVSSIEEWAEEADKLFSNRNWLQAQHAYRKARKPREAKVAEAYYLRELAQKEPDNTQAARAKRRAAFLKAAEAFESSAADALNVELRVSYLRNAAKCCVDIEDHPRAAYLYEQAQEYQASAQHYRKASLFDDAVRVVKTYEDVIANPALIEEILDVSRLFYFTSDRIDKAKALFDSKTDAIEFTDTYGLDAVRATLLEEALDYAEAAELRYQQGDIDDAVRLFLLSDPNVAGPPRACQCILDRLWNLCCLGASREKIKPELGSLLLLSQRVAPATLSQTQRDELSVFKAILDGDRATLAQFSQSSVISLSILSLDHIFSANFCPPEIAIEDLIERLRLFSQYCDGLRWLLHMADAPQDTVVQKLLAFSPMAGNGDVYIIPPHSVLYLTLHPQDVRRRRDTIRQESIAIPKGQLSWTIVSALRRQLQQRVTAQNVACRAVRALKICSQFALEGSCRFTSSPGGCREDHLSNRDGCQYEQLLQALLLQIQVYQTQTNNSAEDFMEHLDQRRYWIALLSSALYPGNLQLGSTHLVNTRRLPERGIRIVSEWLRDGLFRLAPDIRFTITRLLQYALISKALHGEYVPEYVHRIPLVIYSNNDPSWLRRGQDGVSIVTDIVRFLGRGASSLSSAILMIRHILDEWLRVDLGVLCEVLDILCGALILAQRLRTGLLHGLVLPYSWLIQLMERLEGCPPQDVDLLSHYLVSIPTLLEQLYSVGPNIDCWKERFGSRNAGYSTRSLYISRICQNVCLFGYNIRDFALREEVVGCLRSLQRSHENRTFHPVYGRFITLNRWSHIAREVCSETFRPASEDEMVEIIHSSKLAGAWPLANPNMRRLVYTSLHELPELLKKKAYHSNARQRTTIARSVAEDRNSTHVDIESVSGDPELEVERDTIERKDITSISFANTPQADNPDTLSDEQLARICSLQRLYRRTHKRPSERRMVLDSKFRLCFDLAKSNGLLEKGARRYHRVCFLGPFPHLLAGVEGMGQYLHSEKTSVRKKLLKDDHSQLEAIRKHTTNLKVLNDDTIRIAKALDPRANTSLLEDNVRLKDLAREAHGVLARLPQQKVVSVWAEHLSIAYKGLVKPPHPMTKKLLPQLNTNDLNEYDL